MSTWVGRTDVTTCVGGERDVAEDEWTEVEAEMAHERWMEASMDAGAVGTGSSSRGEAGPEEWEEAMDDELWAGAEEPFGDG